MLNVGQVTELSVKFRTSNGAGLLCVDATTWVGLYPSQPPSQCRSGGTLPTRNRSQLCSCYGGRVCTCKQQCNGEYDKGRQSITQLAMLYTPHRLNTPHLGLIRNLWSSLKLSMCSIIYFLLEGSLVSQQICDLRPVLFTRTRVVQRLICNMKLIVLKLDDCRTVRYNEVKTWTQHNWYWRISIGV